MKNTKFIIILNALLLTSNLAFSQEDINKKKLIFSKNFSPKIASKPNKSNLNDSGIFIETSLENSKGTTFQNVYYNNKKISELRWKFDNILMSKIKFGIIFDEQFELNLSYSSSNNNSYKSQMRDLDWLGENGGGDNGDTQHENWTHSSNSIVKTNINEFDIHTKTYLFKKFSINAGYRQQEFDFEDKSQDYIYSCDSFIKKNNTCSTGLRNLSGNFNNANFINYHQRYRIPYIGLGYQDKFFDNKLGVEIFGAYSNSVFVNDRDHHIARNRVTIGSFNRAKYYNLGGNLTYNFYDNFSLRIGYEYSEIPLIKGNLNYKYLDGSEPEFTTKNGAGISSKFEKVSAGLSYLFFLN